jgi:TBC1 domain family member 8/9
MTNAFEYGDALLPDHEKSEEKPDGESTTPPAGSNTPYLNLAT